MKPLALLGALLAAAGHAANPLPLEESKIVQAINDVTRVTMPSGDVEAAVPQMLLHAPDRLRTGRASRAELEAPDGTITRLGSNTIFAFDRASRTMKLDRGSLLFHSPSGRGGGSISSPSATASVLGTTIIAAATPDGGFKLLVLEGRAQVDFPSASPRQLDAGQMIFVRPTPTGAGTPGPTLYFDLARQVKESKLVQGFARPLASRAKIDQAVESQRRSVGQGRYVATGFLVFTATSDTQVNGIEASGADSDDSLVGTFNAHQRLALNTPVTLSSPQLPENRVFRLPLLVPASESVFLNLESDTLLTGLLGESITITSPTLSLANAGVASFNFVAKTFISFAGSTHFTDLSGLTYLRVFAPEVLVPDGATISADFPSPATTTTFYIDTDLTLMLAGGAIQNPTGGLLLQSHGGDLILTNENLEAGATIGAATVVPSAINVDAPLGRLSITGGAMHALSGAFAALAADISIVDTVFKVTGDFWTDSGDSTVLKNLTWTGEAAGSVFQSTAVNLIDAQSLRFEGFSEINLGARTLALRDVNFPANSTVRLVSENGLLAPQPNTNQAVQPGFVNFIQDVTYGGAPAQDFVAPGAGGTGVQPPKIIISSPGI